MSENVKNTHQVYNRAVGKWRGAPGQGLTKFRRFAHKMSALTAQEIADTHADLVAVPLTENP